MAISQTETVQKEVVILEFFDLTLLAWAVMLTGFMTIVTAALGFWGALNYKVSYLKVVRKYLWVSGLVDPEFCGDVFLLSVVEPCHVRNDVMCVRACVCSVHVHLISRLLSRTWRGHLPRLSGNRCAELVLV